MIYNTTKIRTHHEKHLFYSIKVSENKQNGQMQNIQRSLVDRRSLNGLQVIRLHYNTADDIQKYMTVIRESIKVIEIGLIMNYHDQMMIMIIINNMIQYRHSVSCNSNINYCN